MQIQARPFLSRIDTVPLRPKAAIYPAFLIPSGLQTPPVLTWVALALAAALSLLGIAAPEQFMEFTQGINAAFMDRAGTAVVIISSLLMLSCFIIAFSPLGRIRLGAADSIPEFSTLAWLSMLFAAGMGAGLLYWGVAEPVMHLSAPPPAQEITGTIGSARTAMVICYLHWALHPWGIYAAGALCLAYFSFCKGYALLPGTPFRALLPARFHISQAAGDIVDVICVMSLLLGLSASLAAGTMQIASGVRWLGYAPETGTIFPTYAIIVAFLAMAYLFSVSTSINKGIKRLSELNIVLAVLFAVYIGFNASVIHILGTLLQSVADYFRFLPELSFTALHSSAQPDWGKTWTANYFLSWISWIPFVGVFVARISRGRTVREFVLGVALAPALFTFIWFAILGSAALDVQFSGTYDLAADIMADSSSGLFSLLSLFPAAPFLWLLVIVLGFIFLVTSADSASYVLAMLAGRGEENPSPFSKVFWGLVIAILTTTALLSESGIHSVRALFSFAGIAVFFILIAQMLCLGVGLARHRL